MSVTEFQKQVRQYFKELEKRIERDNRELRLLRQLMHEDIVCYPGTAKLQEIIAECLSQNGGHADLPQIREYLAKHGISVERPKLSVILTKSFDFNRAKKRWEMLKKPAVSAQKDSDLPNIHH